MDMSVSVNLLQNVAMVAGVGFLWMRFGLLGTSKIEVYRNDIKIGVFNRFLWHVAQYKVAGDPEVITAWSFSPIEFITQSNLDRKQ